MNAGMNWTTWNSVRAKALARRPIAMPRIAFAIASSTTGQHELAAPADPQVADDDRGGRAHRATPIPDPAPARS
jgi:hypothetical protein